MSVAGPSLREYASAVIVASSVCASCGAAGHQPTRDAQVVERQDPRAGICAAADAAGETAAPPFAVIQQVFDENCTSCHTHGADLDLSAAVSWADLVGEPAPVTESCGGTLVTPGQPDASYLVQKISVNAPCAGMRMPRTEFAPDPLPDCVIALVRNWIAAGAPAPVASPVASKDGGDN
jgi:mono/diheme cytochrome c family protein